MAPSYARFSDKEAPPFDIRLITHPELRRLFGYWHERCPPGGLPGRAIVDPIEMRPWLGNITLVDICRSPLAFRFRLCGSSLVERLGIDLTGGDLTAIPDTSYRREVERAFTRIVATGEPSVAHNRRRIAGRPYDFEVLRLPLAEDGRTVSTLLVCTMYFEVPPLNFAVGTGREPEFTAPTLLD